MTRYLLDSTFLIDHLRGDPEAVRRFQEINASGDAALLTGVTAAEVWSGRRPGSEGDIERFLRYIEYVHPGPATARLAGEWRADARAIGQTVGILDALIAATAYHQEAAVLTRNVHDFSLTPVRIETY